MLLKDCSLSLTLRICSPLLRPSSLTPQVIVTNALERIGPRARPITMCAADTFSPPAFRVTEHWESAARLRHRVVARTDQSGQSTCQKHWARNCSILRMLVRLPVSVSSSPFRAQARASEGP